MIDSTLDVAKHMDDGDGNGINIPSIGNNKPCGTHKRGYSTNAYCDQDHNKYPNCAFDGHKHVTSDQVGLGFSDAMMGAAPGDDFNEDVAVPSN
ncbi:hypothetical protein [Candidatus Sneabacter namystus]|uniref:Uncharacterized protein n=1 Tax=Candidatus Sneabacter namystus TaxID=2601646 RepID=A0A5C0UGZ4_9RICK|nr:hypothetical protein [Candidatus Sneabacter namystus]QEK39358.1 hypothetical protein FZC37_00135 [Candidatus Sneabacter namystus]